MGPCISTNQAEHRILLLGLDGSGKTTILYRMKLGELITTIPTIGFNVETVQLRANNASFTVWDVGGQDKIRGLWRHYFMTAEGLIFVVDSTDTERFSEAANELRQILTEESMRAVPVLIFANKQDLPDSSSAEEIIERMCLTSLNTTAPWKLQVCSAVNNEGLTEGFDTLLKMISSRFS